MVGPYPSTTILMNKKRIPSELEYYSAVFPCLLHWEKGRNLNNDTIEILLKLNSIIYSKSLTLSDARKQLFLLSKILN